MEENLVGYLMNALDEPERLQVERYLRGNAEARAHLELLRQALAPLSEDRDTVRPPRDLVLRTLTHVAEHCCRDLPRLPKTAPRPALADRFSFWRRADVLVAACLLFAVVGLGAPALYQLRQGHAKAQCQANLRQFHAALASYRNVHGEYPNLSSFAPRDVAGMVVPVLHESGLLPPGVTVRCPGNGDSLPPALTLEQLRALTPEEFHAITPRLMPCYAYSLGYKDDAGYHPTNKVLKKCRSCGDAAASTIPLFADRPPFTTAGNSLNHGGHGQNILFEDGHAAFTTLRSLGFDPDIYLNDQAQMAAGMHAGDFVLGASNIRP